MGMQRLADCVPFVNTVLFAAVLVHVNEAAL